MLVPKAQVGYFLMHNSSAANGSGIAVSTWTPEGGSYTTLTLQVANSAVATVTLQATLDDSSETWNLVLAENLSTGVQSSLLTTGLWRAVVVGLRKVRVNIADYSSGQLIVKAVAVA